jgi:DNA-directed RNA polymerase specialized sigma24 family protein
MNHQNHLPHESELSEAKGSVSYWLNELNKTGANDAHRELWDRYFDRLIALARSRLPLDGRREADEEDVALSALNSFFRRAEQGEFPDLNDRDGLWPLLAQITVFKALRNIRRERTQKRGGTRVLRESELEPHDDGTLPTLASLISKAPSVEIVTQMNEETGRLIECLPDEQLKTIVRRKLEGYRNGEIAESMGVGLRTIERKLALIRSAWVDRVEHAE